MNEPTPEIRICIMLLTQWRSCDYVTVSNVYNLTVLYEHKKHEWGDADLKAVE